MRSVKILATVSGLLALTFVSVHAGQGNSGTHGPKTTPTTTHGSSAATHGPSAKAPSTTTHGPSATGAAAKPVKAPTTSKKVDTKLAKADTSTKFPKSKKTDTTTTTTTASTSTNSTSTTSTSGTTTSTPPIDFTSGPVGEKLSKNSTLRTKLESRLKALGYDGTAYQAAYGFKNLGQFVAATNVSRNLGISFEELKLQMTGLSVDSGGTLLKTDTPIKSLGQAIHTVESTVDATAAAQTATTQADAEIKSTSTTASK